MARAEVTAMASSDAAMALVAAIETSLACDECGVNYANFICGQCGDQFCAACIDQHYAGEHEGGDGDEHC